MTAVAPQPTTQRTRTGRVFLAGAFGQGNPGDEALLAAFTGGIGDHDAVVVSADPAATSALHPLASKPASVIRPSSTRSPMRIRSPQAAPPAAPTNDASASLPRPRGP
jgi:hypothetical protein